MNASIVSLALGALGTSAPNTGPAGVASAAVALSGLVGGSRDALMADLPNVSSQVNALQQQASGSGAGLDFPPLAPMPPPQQPAAVPTNDNGKSTIVFSSDDADGDLIH